VSALFTPRGLWVAMTGADRLVCAAALAGAGALALGMRAPAEGPVRAVVLVDRRVVVTLPLDREGTFPVEGRRGPVVLEVSDGAVCVAESDCPQHVCVAMGAKRRPGDLLACVPNALIVRLEGSGPAGTGEEVPDAIAR